MVQWSPVFVYGYSCKSDAAKRLKLIEAVVQNEAKGGKKDFKDVNSVNMLYSDFFDSADHVTLDVD